LGIAAAKLFCSSDKSDAPHAFGVVGPPAPNLFLLSSLEAIPWWNIGTRLDLQAALDFAGQVRER